MALNHVTLRVLLLDATLAVIIPELNLATDVGRRLGSFVDVVEGVPHHSVLYELLSREPEDENNNYPLRPSVDGDMLLTSEQIQIIYKEPKTKRKIVTNKFMLWENAIIPWMFNTKDRKFQRPESKMAVLRAIQHWEENTCLKFVEFASQEYKRLGIKTDAILSFGNGIGCASPVGYAPGVQNVYLDEKSCMQIGTIVHEIGHVIGFFHEQARLDRDSHVTILRDNIRDETRFNFHVTQGLANIADYDLGSIMHYGPKYFSKNGRNTIAPKLPILEFLMGQREKLSFYDIKEVNAAYACAAACRNRPPCDNGGFLFKSCRCNCPEGLSGSRCNKIDPKLSQEEGGIFFLTFGASKLITSGGRRLHTSVTWLIKSHENTTMKMFLTLDLAHDPSAHVCYHWVEIRFNLIGQPGPRFCGSSSIPVELTSSRNIVLIRYDSHDKQYGTRAGFSLNLSLQHPIDRHVVCTFKRADRGECPFYPHEHDDTHWALYELDADQSGFGTDDTSFMYVHSSRDSKGSKATLESAEVKGGHWCVSFRFMLAGTQTYGRLVLVAKTTDKEGTWRLWDTFSYIVQKLNRVTISIKSVQRFQILFEAEVEDNLTIGLTRIELDPRLCDHPERSVDLVHKNDPDSVFTCDFDGDWCGFTEQDGGTLNWSRRHSLPLLGPAVDHTTGSPYVGFFITRDSIVQVGRTGSLISPLILAPSDGCVRFWMYVWGFSPGSLSFALQDDDQKQTTLWSQTFRGFQSIAWCQVMVSFHSISPFRIGLEMTISSWLGTIAVDDVTVLSSHC